MKSIKLKPFKLFLLASLLACGFLPALAGATPVKFDINGHYNIASTLPLDGDFTGTMNVDTATGDLLSFEVVFPGLGAFNNVTSSLGSPVFPIWTIRASNTYGDYLSLAFSTPQVPTWFIFGAGSLVDFVGGTILGNDVVGSHGLPFRGLFSGEITLAQVGVPEPAALGLFGAGVLLLGLFAGLRRRFD